MTTEKSNNELIAEFMGLVNTPSGWMDFAATPEAGAIYENLRFDESWDWLMPVVEKIEENHDVFEVLITGPLCEIRLKSSATDDIISNTSHEQSDQKRKATYRAVVTFIKWYNQRKP